MRFTRLLLSRAVRVGTICMVSAVAFLGLSTAVRAQGAPCAANPLTVNNLTGCFINICIVDLGNGNGNVTCVGVPAGGVAFAAVTPGAPVVGIRNGCCFYGFQPNIAPPPAWFAPNVTLAPGCCCDVLFDDLTCTINIVPTAVPPPTPCRP